MGKKAKGKHRLDKFYYLAKEQGFRARSAFKLVQLNRKYDFLSSAKATLDLCAAPGGWLQVAQKYMPMQSTIVGIDLAAIKPIRGCTTLVEDITTPSCRAAIKRVTPDGLKYDCVLHDGAPNVGGNYAKEAYSQAALTLDALKLATEFLTLDGWFVTKVFRSQEYHALLYAFQQLFKKVESTKPVASRDSSAEIFVVCKGYLAPTKIDPRLLKAEYLFANVEDGAGQGNASKGGQQSRDVLKVEKAKRNRSGYEDGLHSLYKETYAENFITNEKPAEMLGMYHCFILDGGKGKKGTNVVPPKDGFMHLDTCEETNEEIRTLFRDLGVLNKSDFKMLLKWRLQVRKRLGMEDKKKSTAANADEDERDKKKMATPEDENERLLSEMEELQGNMDAEARRKKKKQAKMKQKDRIRAQLGLKGDGEAVVAEEDLFSLVRLKTKEDVDTVANQAAPSVPADYYEDSDSELNATRRKQSRYDSEDSDAENDIENDTSRLDSSLDALYKQYKERQKKKGRSVGEGSKSTGRDKRATLEDDGDGELGSDDDEESDESDSEETRFDEDDDAPLEWENDNDDEAEEKKTNKSKNNLIVEFDPSKVKPSAKATADRWFSNDLFSEIEKTTSATEKKNAKTSKGQAKEDKEKEKKKKEKAKKKANENNDEDSDGEDEDDYESLREEARARKLEKAKEAAKIAKEGELKTKKQQDKLDKKRKKASGGKTGGSGDTTYDSGSDDVDVGRKKRALRAEAAAADYLDIVPRGNDDDDQYDDDDNAADGGARRNVKKGNRRRRADGSDSDESTDVDELSDGARAEILAIGKKMLRRKQREEIIEDSYNRYAFEDDPRDLPDWFVDDERRFMKAEPIYDQSDYEEALANVSIKVDERSIKKVAEAKLRKKKRAKDKMSEARQRAGAIMDQDDIPDVSKVREIEAIYAKANKLANRRKKQIKHVVARKMHKGNAGGPSVDKRMLADRRGQKAAVKRGGGGGGGKKSGGKKSSPSVGKPKKSSLRKNRPRR